MPNLTAFLHLFSTDVLKLTFALLWENRTVGVARDVFLVVSYYKHVYDNKYALECSSWINYIYFLLILTCEYFPLIFSFFRKSVKGWEGEKEKEVEGEGERKRFLWNTMISCTQTRLRDRTFPWLGIEHVTLWCMSQCSNHCSMPSRA